MKILDKNLCQRIKNCYDNSTNRLLFFDYDGTLVPFADRPEAALPGQEIKHLLGELASVKQNTVVIISGRDRNFLDRVFRGIEMTLVAEHGFFIRKPGAEWKAETLLQNTWKAGAREVLKRYREMFPGSMLEEKESALAWHYRNCTNVPTTLQIKALKILLEQVNQGFTVELLEGNKVVEVKEKFITKGSAASDLLKEKAPGFILALGDDMTDEDLFRALPENAFTIKVGNDTSVAKYSCPGQEYVVQLIRLLLNRSVIGKT